MFHSVPSRSQNDAFRTSSASLFSRLTWAPPTTQVLEGGFLCQIGQCRISFHSTCPSPSDRRRQSPNGSPPPERVRDRRGRRGVEGEECGGVSAGGMAYAPPGRRRAARVRSPTTPPDATERGTEAADSRRTRTGLRALCREYPSNCCPQTDADSRLRGAGQIGICQLRVR